jgi:translation initiation factor 2B subunit (eIF-2B alpha/beta/delta family)
MLSPIDSRLQKIFANKTSGSTELLFELHSHLKKEIKIIQLFPEIIELAQKQFQVFQNIISYLNDMKSVLSKNKSLQDFFNKYDKLFAESKLSLLSNAKFILKDYSTFVTISNSKTLLVIFKYIKETTPDLYVLIAESRPLMEGRIFAHHLKKYGVKYEIISEALIPQAIQYADAAVIGADKVMKNGDVINKTGSLLLAYSCKENEKPFYVISNSSKFTLKTNWNQKEMPPSEIWRQNPKKTLVKNLYFEKINKCYITKIISENLH